eukprot:TRINITY_DN28816_c0_g1_i3.p3 TRINITY_DN28816_c0_g1~~TRINITY_DN28816_c0_g1_i3.p3  ORF type:complete len:109 (+),score=14.92 TRINITY_DN28816_c0_g1_i3:75-401(+)
MERSRCRATRTAATGWTASGRQRLPPCLRLDVSPPERAFLKSQGDKKTVPNKKGRSGAVAAEYKRALQTNCSNTCAVSASAHQGDACGITKFYDVEYTRRIRGELLGH